MGKVTYTMTTDSYFTAQNLGVLLEWLENGNRDVTDDAIKAIHYFLDNLAPPYFKEIPQDGSPPPEHVTNREKALMLSSDHYLGAACDEQVSAFAAVLRRIADDIEFMALHRYDRYN